MGIFGTLFGKMQPMKLDNLFVLPNVSIDMEKAGMVYAGKSGVCFKASDIKEFLEVLDQVRAILKGASSKFDVMRDEYGYTWIVISGDIPTAVASIDLVYETLKEAGYERRILCAAFEFSKDEKAVYWIYNRQGKFYPFAPTGKERDVVLEMKLKMLAPEEMPVEAELSQWYPLWDLPFHSPGRS